MRGQRPADLVDRLSQCVSEFLISEMFSHPGNEILPQFVATGLMDGFVAYNREFVGAGGDENENVVALGVFVQSETMKPFLRCNKRIAIQLSALKKNVDLARCFGFGFANCLNDFLVLELTEKFFRSHGVTSSNLRRRRRNFRLRH